MLDAAQQAAEFKSALDNIKSRNIQAVAARMCRVLRDFPANYKSRQTTVDNGGSVVDVDLSGSLFDSVWEENVGSKIVRNMALTPSLAIDSVEALYKFNQILVEHGEQIMSGLTVASFSTEFIQIYNRVNGMVTSSKFSTSEKTLTYAQNGFTLSIKRLGEVDGVGDNIGIYELGKYLSKTDIITQLRVMHGYISSKPWQDSTKSSVVTARGYAAKIETAVLCVIDTILDIAHAIDGLSACAEQAVSGDDDLTTFDPENSERYMEIPAI